MPANAGCPGPVQKPNYGRKTVAVSAGEPFFPNRVSALLAELQQTTAVTALTGSLWLH